ncbi:HipA family kinase [Chloroflexus sp.]|uniref:HipA family kinase n=1 Tax=Chloroflexus sp. TaxID=1904827 RepID=UPI00262BB071|nr:HipA family kinase [uncultured Chloroflexus sp.]
MLRKVTATRYVAPLREGGSLPAIVEADDDGLYVVKFRGAGQGPKVLVAELICGELARALGLPAPELVLIEVDPALGRNEPDGEIQDLVTASAGLNLAVDFLPGALAFDPTSVRSLNSELASLIVWFDAFITNVDRTPRNTNLLWWHRRLFLIDHGAALYMHFTWHDYQNRARAPFTQIRDHVLLPAATHLAAVDEALARQITPELLGEIIAQVPGEWLEDPRFPSVEAHRAAYIEYFTLRLTAPRAFVQEAINARERL